MLRIAPRDSAVAVTAWSMMGDVYHLMNDTPKAYKAYDNVLKIAPGYAPVLNNYAYYLSEEGKKLKKAYAMSKKTVEAEPDNATYLDTFGWILYLQGKALEAKPFFKHAMLYGGKDSATILNHYAAVLEALGENDLAKVYRQQAKTRRRRARNNDFIRTNLPSGSGRHNDSALLPCTGHQSAGKQESQTGKEIALIDKQLKDNAAKAVTRWRRWGLSGRKSRTGRNWSLKVTKKYRH